MFLICGAFIFMLCLFFQALLATAQTDDVLLTLKILFSGADVSLNEPRHEKTCFCICQNKGTVQLRGDRAADQCLCFGSIDSAIPLLSISEIPSL